MHGYEMIQEIADRSNGLWKPSPGSVYPTLSMLEDEGLIAAVDPRMATGIAGGMTAYLRGIPEELYALFGTGYLGYTAARTWGKLRGVEK